MVLPSVALRALEWFVAGLWAKQEEVRKTVKTRKSVRFGIVVLLRQDAASRTTRPHLGSIAN